MTQISIQVTDCMHGRPAPGVAVDLARHDEGGWHPLAGGTTLEDGSLPAAQGCRLARGHYRLAVRSAGYFAGLGCQTHYGVFSAEFQVNETDLDLRAVIYISPAAFTTYWQWE
jgi:5-hydroxyisourate hydrolase